MVGVARIELATPAMSTQCSTTELHAHTARAFSWGVVWAQGSLWPKRLFGNSAPALTPTRPPKYVNLNWEAGLGVRAGAATGNLLKK
jgi:hypothetical protein